MRYRLLGIPESFSLGKGHIASSLQLRNHQETSFSIAGFKVETLKWKRGTAQNKVVLKQCKTTLYESLQAGAKNADMEKKLWGEPDKAAQPTFSWSRAVLYT